jgi:hypothetical protein
LLAVVRTGGESYSCLSGCAGAVLARRSLSTVFAIFYFLVLFYFILFYFIASIAGRARHLQK